MTQFIGIRSEGGLLPYDILDKIAREEDGFGQRAKNFGLPAGRRLTDEISRAWSDAQDYWHIFQRRSENLPEDETGTTLTRKWVSDLLNELLGYELTYQPTGAVVGGRNYQISHRAGQGEQSPPVHIEGFRIDIDRRVQGRRMSSQALVQEYLNNSDGHLWGIVTNGTLFRLLRDTSRTSRPSFLEFDLQSILDGNRFNEFALFYRVCHRSRLPKTAEDSTSCWLEKYFQISIEQGGRVRDKLRDGVEDALKRLGTGFLQHPKNEHLRERVNSGTLTAAEFHRQLLRLVYRLLFLMVAEERRMIVPEAPDSERRQRLYDNYYSVGRLRNLAEESIEPSTFGDLWIGLQQTFRLFEDVTDSNPLGVPPLNGDLFSNIAVKDLLDTHLFNSDLLYSIHRLSLFDERRVLQRVNYRDLDVEELGSVYESLLDYQPVFVPEAEGTRFDLRTGSERKSTGSYYTRPELVRELIESALVPVMQDRLDAAKDKEGKQQAILSMSVCDPACGSGHFLLAAARRLGRELARIRTGEDEPTPKEFHLAVRDVIAHCIYGVDLNPLAVDLCKLALWLEGHWTGKPLSFLDHRIKLGNSLVGVLDMKVLDEGIPDEAFSPVTGDDKKVASAFKKRNKDERKGQSSLPFDAVDHVHDFASESADLITIEEDTPADVRRKKHAYEKSRQRPEWWHDWVSCNLWTASFFVPLLRFDDPTVPTHEKLLQFIQRRDSQPQMAAVANALAEEKHFFHWRLEFPEVFEKGGFHALVGNPPWDQVQPEEVAFFDAAGVTSIAKLRGAKRKQQIERLSEIDPALFHKWRSYKGNIESVARFIRGSRRFPLTAVGKLNTYALFAELSRKLKQTFGRVGMVVPTGIITDEGYRDFLTAIFHSHELASLIGFINSKKLFLAVKDYIKFGLLTLGTAPEAQFMHLLTDVSQVNERERRFSLTDDDLLLFNPNTRTCPVFRSRTDASLTKKLYRKSSVLVNELLLKNEWDVEFKQGLFNMTSDSHLFSERECANMSRLYEAKMFHIYDHRFATYEGATEHNINEGNLPQLDEQMHQDPALQGQPLYWVPQESLRNALGKYDECNWLVGFRDVTGNASERTAIFSVLPRTAVGHNTGLLFSKMPDTARLSTLIANLNSLILDYAARQKVAGAHLSIYIVKQLPVIPPSGFQDRDIEFIASRVLLLVYSAWDVKPFADDLWRHFDATLREKTAALWKGINGARPTEGIPLTPRCWNELERAACRAELDAYYAHLYGLTRDELRYILDPKDVFGGDFPSETFRVLKEREKKEHGEYRTQRLVLEAFDRLAESPRFKDEIGKRKSSLAEIGGFAGSRELAQ